MSLSPDMPGPNPETCGSGPSPGPSGKKRASATLDPDLVLLSRPCLYLLQDVHVTEISGKHEQLAVAFPRMIDAYKEHAKTIDKAMAGFNQSYHDFMVSTQVRYPIVCRNPRGQVHLCSSNRPCDR